MHKILFSLSLIISGVFSGYIIQFMVQRGILQLPLDLACLRRNIQKAVILFIVPLTVIGALWKIEFDDIRVAAFPLIGACHYVLGGIFALLAAKLLKLDRKKTGSLFCSGFFTNIGSVGGLVVYTFLGEDGFALVPVYHLFGHFFYYTLGFPIARFYSSSQKTGDPLLPVIRRVLSDKFVRATVSAIIIGSLLNLSGIERPTFYAVVNSIFIPVAAFLMLVSIGLAMRFSKVWSYPRECMAIGIIRMIIMPMVLPMIAFFLGYHTLMGGIAFKVVLILSFMPVAFIGMIPPSIYDLDLDLSNSCWLFSTASLIFVIPVLFLVLSVIPF